MVTPLKRSARCLLVAGAALVLAVPLSACTSNSDATSGATATSTVEGSASGATSDGAVDCFAARGAMTDYSTSLVELAKALENEDVLLAVASADAMSFWAMRALEELPGAPAEAADFVTASQDVATLVKQDLSDEVPFPDIITQVTQAFAADAFTVGGDALDAYANEVCPESPSPTSN